MSFTAILNPFSLAALACEKYSSFAEVIRRLHFRGKGRIVQRIHSEAMEREVVANCGGVLYRLDLRDDVQRELYFGIYEPVEIRDALRLIPSGGMCVDIGANNGAFALQFAKKVGPGGMVHAIEPDSAIYPRLQANCVLNGFEKRMKCHQLAVSNVGGTLTFYKSEAKHSGWGSLAEFRDIAVQADSVQAVTLDEFLAKEDISHVDFLKVDVEAHEPELLEGAANSLRDHVFQFILIEFNGLRLRERGKSLPDFLKPMLAAGYEVVRPRADQLKKMLSGAIASETVLINFLLAATKTSDATD